MFWVQRNLGFREVEKFGSFKKDSHRFLIKTNVGKIWGAERFGPKQFGSRKKLSPKKCWSKKVWIQTIMGQQTFGFTKFWLRKKFGSKLFQILCPKKFVGPKKFGSNKIWFKSILIKRNHGLQKLYPKSFVKIGSVAEIFMIWANFARTNVS